jgi:hypothetical protein
MHSTADDLAMPTVFVVLVALGFAWIRRITRAEDDLRSAWRYQSDGDGVERLTDSFIRDWSVVPVPSEPPDANAQVESVFHDSWRRAQHGRIVARLMMWVTVLMAAFVFLGPPLVDPMSGGTDPRPFLVGLGGVIVGLAWMVRILRADPEPDRDGWLYRAR